MPKITLADLTSEPTTVELFECSYSVKTLTRSVQKQLEKVQPKLAAINKQDDSDQAIALLADAFDVLLAPENGSPPAKKTITEAWKRDEITVGQLGALFDQVEKASAARPT